jgi:hypothetical protein
MRYVVTLFNMADNNDFILQAYMLYSKNSGHQDSFKTTIIDTIVAEFQSVPGEDRCVLLLGYKGQMEEMFQVCLNTTSSYEAGALCVYSECESRPGS